MNFSLTHFAKRFLLMLTAVIFMSATASAYTVVMRGGKRIEIPEQFTVTRITVTYEAAPGINITLQMTSIDIPATERANNEQPGSLLKRAEPATSEPQTSTRLQSAGTIPHKPRVITDRDLERFKRVRLESEAAYERRLVKLGLPPLEESRRRTELQAESLHQELVQRKSEEAQAESYWRGRANDLISEIGATDAQIDFVRARLSESTRSSAAGSFTIVSSPVFGNPFGYRGFGAPRLRGYGPRAGGGLAGRQGFGNRATAGKIWVSSANTVRQFYPQPVFPGFQPVYGSPFQSTDYSDPSELSAWLDRLVANRVALQARFRMLEEEARRAGVPPGWLRP
jgi:hypothetical protein